MFSKNRGRRIPQGDGNRKLRKVQGSNPFNDSSRTGSDGPSQELPRSHRAQNWDFVYHDSQNRPQYPYQREGNLPQGRYQPGMAMVPDTQGLSQGEQPVLYTPVIHYSIPGSIMPGTVLRVDSFQPPMTPLAGPGRSVIPTNIPTDSFSPSIIPINRLEVDDPFPTQGVSHPLMVTETNLTEEPVVPINSRRMDDRSRQIASGSNQIDNSSRLIASGSRLIDATTSQPPDSGNSLHRRRSVTFASIDEVRTIASSIIAERSEKQPGRGILKTDGLSEMSIPTQTESSEARKKRIAIGKILAEGDYVYVVTSSDYDSMIPRLNRLKEVSDTERNTYRNRWKDKLNEINTPRDSKRVLRDRLDAMRHYDEQRKDVGKLLYNGKFYILVTFKDFQALNDLPEIYWEASSTDRNRKRKEWEEELGEEIDNKRHSLLKDRLIAMDYYDQRSRKRTRRE